MFATKCGLPIAKPQKVPFLDTTEPLFHPYLSCVEKIVKEVNFWKLTDIFAIQPRPMSLCHIQMLIAEASPERRKRRKRKFWPGPLNWSLH
jgi:hypothetical protein